MTRVEDEYQSLRLYFMVDIGEETANADDAHNYFHQRWS